MARESPGTEFKRGAARDAIEDKLLKTLMAMANRRDGGLIIIGYDSKAHEHTGVDGASLDTFDQDDLRDLVRRFAAPAPEFDIVVVNYNARSYVAIEVFEFSYLPIICAASRGSVLRSGDVYVRPVSGAVRTERVCTVAEMQDLLDLGAEKRLRAFFSQAKRTGLSIAAADNPYDSELGDLHQW